MYYFLPIDRCCNIPNFRRAKLEISQRRIHPREGKHSEETRLLNRGRSRGDFGGMKLFLIMKNTDVRNMLSIYPDIIFL